MLRLLQEDTMVVPTRVGVNPREREPLRVVQQLSPHAWG